MVDEAEAGPTPLDASAWSAVFSAVTDDGHLATGDRLSDVVDQAVQTIGLRAELLIVDFPQRVLRTITVGQVRTVLVEGTVPGRVFQLGEMRSGSDDDGSRLLWVPMLDGTERVGVLRLVLGADEADPRDDEVFRDRCLSLAGLMGHIVMTKVAYSDHLRRLRTGGPLSVASELLWELAPPRTFAAADVVVSALLEPYDRVAGDAYDYAVDDVVVDLAVYDGVGHDLAAGVTTALAVTAVRNARRSGERDLAELATRADEILAESGALGTRRFVTAVLVRLERATGRLHYLLAGHPPPLLVRGGHIVKELTAFVQRPLGVATAEGRAGATCEQLEPGDRVLVYTDGITEARDVDGRFFGLDQLIDLTERAEQDHVSAPETLRRLTHAVLAHQHDVLQDDATLVMLDWSAAARDQMFPRDSTMREPWE
jgi:hypothetical protein